MDEAGAGASGAVFGGRYRIERSLKSGNGVDTFLARELGADTPVVLKSIDPAVVPAAARLRFQHESVVLRQLSGAGLPGLLDAGFADDRLYLVQPYVAGVTLEAMLRDGPLPLLTTLRLGIAVATALSTAHDAGVCHRDVKPANIVVLGRDPVEAVTLVDFGFARSPWLDESIREDLVGTVRYLAPEAAGLLAAPVDERSDLYALGVLLFECVAAQPPFRGPGVSDLLRQHLSMPVPALPTTGPAVPRALDAVVQRLLRKEPAERYQSAAAVAADLTALLHAVEQDDLDPHLVIGRLDHRCSLTDPAFVGRDVEMAVLLDLVHGLRRGSGGLTLLEAESGGGKSRLLSEVAQQARHAGVSVLHGQGVAQAAQRPFTLLHSMAQDLLDSLDDEPGAADAVIAAVSTVAPEVVRALPSLGPLLGVSSENDSGPEQFGEQRSLDALRILLLALGTRERPVLLVFDDCQWADTLTVRLLASLAAAPAPHLGVLVAFRSEEVPAGHLLRAIRDTTVVRLGPLTPVAMSMLAESMAGPLPDEAVEAVARLADGSPFMGAAVLRGLVEGKALVAGPDGWSFDAAALQDVQTARRSAVFLVRRLELLPDDALSLLSIGAVLGKQFDVTTAVHLAGQAPAAAAILEDARRRRLLWVDERTGRCTFFHDKIREALLDRLDQRTRQELHSRAADGLARAEHGGSDFELAYHLDAAGRGAEGLPHALAAAELSRTQHALDAAVTHYRMAGRAVQDDDLPHRVRIAEGLGDVLTLQGVYGEAELRLSRARSLVDDPVHAAALDGKLGDLAFKQGDIATAKRHLEGAVARLGRPVPAGTVLLVVRLLWEVLVQAGHTLLPRLTTGRRSAEGQESDFLAMRLYSRLAYLYWFHSGTLPCAWVHFRGLNLAERYPPSAELGQAYSEHAPVCTMLPAFRRGVRYASRSLEIRRRLGDVWGQGQSRGFSGVVLYAASRYEQAAVACREAIALLERTGDRWEMNTAGWNLAMCQHRRGELVDAAATGERVFRAAQAIGDPASAGIALSVWAKATGGRIDPELLRTELERGSEDAHTASELHLADALRLLHEGEIERAVSKLVDGITVVRRAGLRQEYVAPLFPWHATALRRLAEATPGHNPALRARRLRAAAKA
ncbi:MAG: AAA family ATPase, partial [Actinomycetota bacterium]|nr:AAA family ATPase [Actinomycetota bacterium]